ncbi:hypothetical protein K431DRAFT_88470 [Polychaeton citri CBS 116435]|uniref:Secreted protein n=1 Tax=Polychaeton citri CBS 116435 TaxID=1314669 RepID=A0A9P4UPN1_9PEZI|nr:hypothetical protein K431DRAFT_88470 [Polychaeton citri CBS 116435]
MGAIHVLLIVSCVCCPSALLVKVSTAVCTLTSFTVSALGLASLLSLSPSVEVPSVRYVEPYRRHHGKLSCIPSSCRGNRSIGRDRLPPSMLEYAFRSHMRRLSKVVVRSMVLRCESHTEAARPG